MRNLLPPLLFLFFVRFVFGQGEIVGTGASPAKRPAMYQYQIEIKLIETMPDGREWLLSNPELVTIEERPASIDIRADTQPPKGIKLDEPLRSGIYVLVTVLRKDGHVFLDATVNKSQADRTDAEGVYITTESVRVVERITLGKKIVVHPPWAKTLRWEMLVQEPQPKTFSGNTRTTHGYTSAAKAE